MRVLFFCTDPTVYSIHSGNYRIGGGWVTSLISEMHRTEPEWTLGVCCEGTGTWGGNCGDFVRYPIDVFQRRINKLKRKIFSNAEETLLLPDLLRAIQDFQPDIIQVFGSESPYGIVAAHTSIPVIIHFQGSLKAYYNALYPPGISFHDYIHSCGINIFKRYRIWQHKRIFRQRAEREVEILQHCRHYFGRTQWDRAIIEQYHPGAEYFFCSESLRSAFYENAAAWTHRHEDPFRIVSVISSPTYKGHDLILKTAQLLKSSGFFFKWNVFGIDNMEFYEKKLGIKACDVNVKLCGTIADPERLKDEFLSANVYLHPAYIENSPNSLCEAQILGVPVIATHVGGISSLVEHEKTGLLIPANDPYMAAAKIRQLAADSDHAKQLGAAGSAAAQQRHRPDLILNAIKTTYAQLVGNAKGKK